MSLSDNYDRIRDDISGACARANRAEQDVTLVAVTKFVPLGRIEQAVALGIRHVGENRAQELLEKLDRFREWNCGIHFIGQLQTNKVKYITGQVNLVQSVDRLQLAQELDKQAKRQQIVQDILIQVNIGHEPQKGGIDEESLMKLLDEVQAMHHIRVMGLMCVPPVCSPEESRPFFARMRELFEKVKGAEGSGITMRHLSMGMSADYQIAIEEGATIIRVGSALFGQRM